jgi:antitoxin HigA-1
MRRHKRNPDALCSIAGRHTPTMTYDHAHCHVIFSSGSIDTRYNEVISLSSLRVQVRDNKMRMHNPAHPGELLREYMGKRSANLVAARLEVTQAALSRLLKGHDSVSGEMAFKLSRVFGTSPDLWLNMQIHFDLWQASRVKRKRIARVVTA